MTEHERNQTPEPRPDAGEQDNASPSRGMSRRRFGQAALGSVPVLMTLYSNPLRAGGGNCDPSGWYSGGSQHGEAESCGSDSPGKWWRSPAEPVETWGDWLFSSSDQTVSDLGAGHTAIFSGAPSFYEDDKETPLRMKYAVRPQNLYPIYKVSGGQVEHQERKVIRFGAAAWLNRHFNRYDGPRPDEKEIVEMVEKVLNGGYYRSAAGDLNTEDVANFLENTVSEPQYRNA